MSRPVLYVAITNHGFGHATRTASVVAEIQRQCPDILVILATSAPRWLLESYLDQDFIHRPRALDLGVVQSDSLTIDRLATLEKLKFIQSQQRSLVASEVNFIQQNRVNLILADIPPLATAIAQAADIPCWMISNFGWDLIYRDWGSEFSEIADWVSQCFARCDRLFRLPFHESMRAFPSIVDVGLTGASPRYPQAELLAKFDLWAGLDRTILLTFGGLGLNQIPYQNLQEFPDWQFITFDRHAPDLPNLLKITDLNYRPVDFLPLCGRVISKPGYGTFAEACRVGTPVVSLTRSDFAEARFLLEGLQNYSYHQILDPIDFLTNSWEFLHQPLCPPHQAQPLAKDGNVAIAEAVISQLQTSSCNPCS
jgi:hypothetical protein